MHQQDVVRVRLEPDLVGHARSHRHGRDARSADQRIDRLRRQAIHEFAHEYATRRADRERHHAQQQDADGAHGEELLRAQLRAHGQAEEDRHDIDQRILRRVGQAVHDPAFAHQVAEREHAEQRRRSGQQQPDQ